LSDTITTNPFSPISGKTTPIVLVVSPSLNAEGRKAYSTRGQLFDGKVDGRTIVKRSTTPFCDAARALLAEGVRPEAKLVMRHAGSAADALRSTVGVAAGLTVVDDNGGKPIFRKWSPSPYDREETIPVAGLCAKWSCPVSTPCRKIHRTPSHDGIFHSHMAPNLR